MERVRMFNASGSWFQCKMVDSKTCVCLCACTHTHAWKFCEVNLKLKNTSLCFLKVNGSPNSRCDPKVDKNGGFKKALTADTEIRNYPNMYSSYKPSLVIDLLHQSVAFIFCTALAVALQGAPRQNTHSLDIQKTPCDALLRTPSKTSSEERSTVTA